MDIDPTKCEVVKKSCYDNSLPDASQLMSHNDFKNNLNISPSPPCFIYPLTTFPTSEKHQISCISFLPFPHKIFISVGESINLYEFNLNKKLRNYPIKRISSCHYKQPIKIDLQSNNKKEVLGVFTEYESSIFMLGTHEGHLQLYDIRIPSQSPCLVATEAHKGPISAISSGIPYNSNYIFTSGYEDGWVKEFDLRFFYHNSACSTAHPMQSIYVEKDSTNNNISKSNTQSTFKSKGILSMKLSPDGSLLALSTSSGECNLYRIGNVPMRRIKQWVLGDFSSFYDIQFTNNSKYILCCAENINTKNFSAYLWDTLKPNHSISLKSPGDGASIYQHHFLIKENISNEKHKFSKELFKPTKRLFLLNKSDLTQDIQNHTLSMQSKYKSCQSLTIYTPESSYLESLHQKFWEYADSLNNAQSKFQNLSNQQAAFYSNCGILHPSYGRTDLYNRRFICTPWGGTILGIGGSHIFDGMHIWEGNTGLCLNTSQFQEANSSSIRCISLYNDVSKGIFATGHTTNKFNEGFSTLWKVELVDNLVNNALYGNMINLTIDP